MLAEKGRTNKWLSKRLRAELPGLRGFSNTNLKNMRLFNEAWNMLEHNSVVTTAELEAKSSVTTDKTLEVSGNEMNTIRQLRLTNYDMFLNSCHQRRN